MTYSFLKSPRWIGLTIIMIVLSVACVFLGFWQWGRYHEKADAAEQIRQAWDAESVTLDEIGHVDADEEWRTVTMTGTYRDDQVLLRGRSVSGHPAVHVINLFDTTYLGSPVTVIIDRGWLPMDQVEGYGGSTVTIPDPPVGQETTLVTRARPAEEPYDRTPPAGYTYTLNPSQVLSAMGSPDVTELLDGRFEAQPGQLGSDKESAPLAYERPSTHLGNHFAYAWEWWFFAVAAQFVVPILARREAQENSWVIDGVDLRTLDLSDDEIADLGLVKKEKKKRRASDEEIEDAILDQANAMSSK